jgi:hypothetical protein
VRPPVLVGLVLAPRFLALTAGDPDLGVLAAGLLILASHSHADAPSGTTEGFTVSDQSLGAAEEVHGKDADRNVGDRRKGGSEPPVDRVDLTDRGYVNLTVKVDDKIGQAARGRSKIDGALKWLG